MSAETPFFQNVSKLTEPYNHGIAKLFDNDQRISLETMGYTILPLRGHSIKSLIRLKFPFWSTWQNDTEIAKMRSLRTEVACYPGLPFLPNSKSSSYNEYITTTLFLLQKLQKSIPNIACIIGNPVDYAELAYRLWKSTKQTAFDINAEKEGNMGMPSRQ
jgi:hypothetical protein